MQSSTLMAARSFLMIVCMVVVPVLAIFGTDWIGQLGREQPAAPAPRRLPPGHAAAAGESHARAPAGRPPAAAPAWTSAGSQGAESIRASFEVPVANSPPSAGSSPISPGVAPDHAGQPIGRLRLASASPSSKPAERPAAANDWFRTVQQRLKQLGATYYLLETWGRGGELYRFHCKMAIGGNPDYTRHFEATDRDAAKAMQDVLAQIEAWRAGREP